MVLDKGVELCIRLLPILLLVACGQVAAGGQEATPTPLPTPVLSEKARYVVQQGTVQNALRFAGRIGALQEEELFFRSDGFVDRVNFAPGDRVEQGDVVAQLDVRALEAELARARLALRRAQTVLAQAQQEQERAVETAELELQRARAALQQTQAGAASAEVTRTEIAVSRAQEALAYWQYELQKAQDRPWERQEVLDNYARQVRQAEQNLQIAQEEHRAALSHRSAGAQSVELQRLDAELAELDLQALQEGVDPLLALDVEKARLDVADLQAKIRAAQLQAPFHGRLVALDAQPGDAVSAYEALAIVADPALLEVVADPGADTLRQVTVGMTATVELRQRPGAPLMGSVRGLPGAFGSSLEDDDGDRFIHVALPEDAGDSGGVELGDLATVTIVLERKDGVLWLPPAAIRSFQGRQFVVVQEEEGQRRVDVRLGIEGQERLEILEGLQEGQVVVGE